MAIKRKRPVGQITGLSKRDRNTIRQALGEMIAAEDARNEGYSYANESWRRRYLLNLAKRVIA